MVDFWGFIGLYPESQVSVIVVPPCRLFLMVIIESSASKSKNLNTALRSTDHRSDNFSTDVWYMPGSIDTSLLFINILAGL